MRRVLTLALATILAGGSALVNSGCGTVLGHAGLQPLHIELNPDAPDALIRVNGVNVKESRDVEIDSRRESNTIEVTTPDGRVGKGTVTRELIPFVVVADACMLIFPIYIDYLNGGMYRMDKNITINLGKPPEITPQKDPDFTRPPSHGTNAANEAKPCAFCGESRPVNAVSCPHCGQK